METVRIKCAICDKVFAVPRDYAQNNYMDYPTRCTFCANLVGYVESGTIKPERIENPEYRAKIMAAAGKLDLFRKLRPDSPVSRVAPAQYRPVTVVDVKCPICLNVYSVSKARTKVMERLFLVNRCSPCGELIRRIIRRPQVLDEVPNGAYKTVIAFCVEMTQNKDGALWRTRERERQARRERVNLFEAHKKRLAEEREKKLAEDHLEAVRQEFMRTGVRNKSWLFRNRRSVESPYECAIRRIKFCTDGMLSEAKRSRLLRALHRWGVDIAAEEDVVEFLTEELFDNSLRGVPARSDLRGPAYRGQWSDLG